jgi:hypothetical protein
MELIRSTRLELLNSSVSGHLRKIGSENFLKSNFVFFKISLYIFIFSCSILKKNKAHAHTRQGSQEQLLGRFVTGRVGPVASGRTPATRFSI